MAGGIINVVQQQLDQFQVLIKTFNWHSPSWDLFIILFWLVASVLYAFATGRGRVIAMLLSLYAAKLFTLQIPGLENFAKHKLPVSFSPFASLVVFGVIFLILFLYLSKYTFQSAVDRKHMRGFIYSLGFSFLQVGLMINTVISLLPAVYTSKLSPLISFLFIQPVAGIFWLAAPMLFLIVLGRFVSERSDY